MELRTYLELYGVAEFVRGIATNASSEAECDLAMDIADRITAIINSDLPWEFRRKEAKTNA